MSVVSERDMSRRLRDLFGGGASCEGPSTEGGAVLRLIGVDLRPRLTPDQVAFLLDALSQYRIISMPGQDLASFSMAHFERFANHWGAPIPHPNNFTRGGKMAQSDGASDGAIEWLPFERRTATAVNASFPDQLQCLPHESPTVLVVSNFSGPIEAAAEGEPTPARVTSGGSWHADIEYEPLPIYVSMFLVHKSPVARNADTGTWVEDPTQGSDDIRPYLEGSHAELYRLRKHLPLNGETAFADTVAAFAALPPSEQESLARVQVRRRLNEGDEGWLAPLVRTDPRSGLRCLHSPIWASRPRVRPAVEVDGMDAEASREFLDQLEAHVLQPEFRYDHLHVPGDVTYGTTT